MIVKKIFALLLVFATLLTLAACGTNPAEQGTSGSVDTGKQETSNKGNTEFEITNSNFEETTYQVGGFNFYCPKVCKVATESKEMGFQLDNDMDGTLIGYQNCQGYSADVETDNRYVVVASAPCMWSSQNDEEKKTITSAVTLDNIAELTKGQIIELFNSRSFVRKGWLGDMTLDHIGMVFEKSEKVTINGIDMVKLEGHFEDLQNTGIKDVPFYAYYMIAETKDGNKIPVHYLGLPFSNGTYEEVVNYMDTYIQRVEKVW